jgi:hypothetical protein
LRIWSGIAAVARPIFNIFSVTHLLFCSCRNNISYVIHIVHLPSFASTLGTGDVHTLNKSDLFLKVGLDSSVYSVDNCDMFIHFKGRESSLKVNHDGELEALFLSPDEQRSVATLTFVDRGSIYAAPPQQVGFCLPNPKRTAWLPISLKTSNLSMTPSSLLTYLTNTTMLDPDEIEVFWVGNAQGDLSHKLDLSQDRFPDPIYVLSHYEALLSDQRRLNMKIFVSRKQRNGDAGTASSIDRGLSSFSFTK